MRMMPVTASVDLAPQALSLNKSQYNESTEKTSFKLDYENKIEKLNENKFESNSVNEKSNRIETKDEKIINSDKTKNQNEIKDNKSETKIETKSNKVDEKVKQDGDEKTLKNIKNKNAEKNVSLEKVADFVENNSVKNSKNVKDSINKIKNVVEESITPEKSNVKNKSKTELQKSDTKTDGNKVKSEDENNLNQIVVAQLNNQENSKKNDINLNNTTDDKTVKIDSEKSISKGENSLNVNQKIVNVNKLESNLKEKVEKSDKKNSDKLKVVDFRQDKKSQVVENNKQNIENDLKIEKSNDVQSKEVIKNQDNNEEIILGNTNITVEGDGGKQQAPVFKEVASQIKQQLKDFGNNEIVKQSKFILKDNNIGEIKLILKPESLGQVKINLNLNENSLAGQIVVENNSVKEIFQENMNNLTRALEDQGYDSAELELTMDDKNDSKDNKKENKQYFSERLKRLDESGNVVRYGLASAGIDLTA